MKILKLSIILIGLLLLQTSPSHAQYFGVSGQYNTLLGAWGIGGKYLYDQISFEGLYFFTGTQTTEFDMHYNTAVDFEFKNSWQVSLDYNFELAEEDQTTTNIYAGGGYFRYDMSVESGPNTQIASASTGMKIYLSTLEGHIGFLYGDELYIDAKLGYLVNTNAKGEFTMKYENTYGDYETATVDLADYNFKLIDNTFFLIGIGYFFNME
jgi:hypothetical protein